MEPKPGWHKPAQPLVTVDLGTEAFTAERVSEHFAGLLVAPVQRYSLPSLGALNFVLQRPLAQSVTRSLALDAHGKCLGSALLAMQI